MGHLSQTRDVHHVRKAGWLTGGDPYSHGASIVVVGVTSYQGDGNTVHRAKGGRQAGSKYKE